MRGPSSPGSVARQFARDYARGFLLAVVVFGAFLIATLAPQKFGVSSAIIFGTFLLVVGAVALLLSGVQCLELSRTVGSTHHGKLHAACSRNSLWGRRTVWEGPVSKGSAHLTRSSLQDFFLYNVSLVTTDVLPSEVVTLFEAVYYRPAKEAQEQIEAYVRGEDLQPLCLNIREPRWHVWMILSIGLILLVKGAVS